MVDVPAGDWITVAEAAELLNLTKRRVQVLVKTGRIPAKKVGNQFLLTRAVVVAFKAIPRDPGRPAKPPPPVPPPKRRGKAK
jgi:excisionase family DNA binding protein